jgi:hypothetical protein
VTPEDVRRDYESVFERLDPDTKGLLAVDRPYLVDTAKHDFDNLDFPGWAAPGGEFPFFTGARPKIQKLRSAGYDTLVVTRPDLDLCLSPATLQQVMMTTPRPSGIYARFDLDWQNSLARIARDAPGAVQTRGPFWIIDLELAERGLRESRAARTG